MRTTIEISQKPTTIFNVAQDWYGIEFPFIKNKSHIIFFLNRKHKKNKVECFTLASNNG